jgi:hypothetical protein
MDDEDDEHLVEIRRVLSEAGAWTARTSAGAPRLRAAPRSSLRGDDDRAFPYTLSQTVWRLLSNAVDHLGCLRALLDDAQVIHMYAPFTLVRAALENACGAVWLLEPVQRKERLTRQFRLAITDIRHDDQAGKLTGQLGPQTVEERISEIRGLAARAGLESAALKGNVTYTEIVETVDRAGPPDSIVLVAWKVCSGFAHGDWWTTRSASRRTQIPGAAEPGIGTFKIEADLSLLKNMATLAVLMTRRGWQLHDQRCRPPY